MSYNNHTTSVGYILFHATHIGRNFCFITNLGSFLIYMYGNNIICSALSYILNDGHMTKMFYVTVNKNQTLPNLWHSAFRFNFALFLGKLKPVTCQRALSNKFHLAMVAFIAYLFHTLAGALSIV